jgi:hypothetical protein
MLKEPSMNVEYQAFVSALPCHLAKGRVALNSADPDAWGSTFNVQISSFKLQA